MEFNKIDTPAFDQVNPMLCINGKLRRLHKLISNYYGTSLNTYGLRGSMLSILFIIGKKPGVNQRTLSDRLVLDASTMSRDLKKLSDKGWVRHQKGSDARNTELFLTEEGYLFLEEVSPIWEELHHKMEALFGQFCLQQIDLMINAMTEFNSAQQSQQ